MVHVYYHIYAINGVESIIDEQLSLIKKHFDFPYTLNLGISIPEDNKSISNILDIIDKSNVRDIRAKGHEFITLDLIQKDKEKFGDSDYILYLHTKGASKLDDTGYKNIKSWRELMNYFNIEKCKNVIKIFEKSQYNTYGVLLGNVGKWQLYSGNFWWAKASYLKTINIDDNALKTRFDAECKYIQMGENWKPYSPYNNSGDYEGAYRVNHYDIMFKREEYAK
jgi:hypothetical protein